MNTSQFTLLTSARDLLGVLAMLAGLVHLRSADLEALTGIPVFSDSPSTSAQSSELLEKK